MNHESSPSDWPQNLDASHEVTREAPPEKPRDIAQILATELAPERASIDVIDDTILRLLNERVTHALRVGEKKEKLGLPLHDPSREKLIYERLREKNANHGAHLPDIAVTAIFREIISACRNAEGAIRVAFLGPSGTNTQEAAVQYFGSAFSALPCATPKDVCEAVLRGARNRNATSSTRSSATSSTRSSSDSADYGVIAIENSIEGVVSSNLDLLADLNLTICAEVELNIHHALMSNSELGRITTVYSHPHALAQCRSWLLAHLPNARLVPVDSTARGAEMSSQEDGAAAIGAAIAADVYGLQIVAGDIEDLANNRTRFFVVAPVEKAPRASGRDKTSMAFLVPHTPGALVRVLDVLQKHAINLSMIQSRPSRQANWEYRFFADLQAHRDDQKLQNALKELEQHTISVKILGSYAEAAS